MLLGRGLGGAVPLDSVRSKCMDALAGYPSATMGNRSSSGRITRASIMREGVCKGQRFLWCSLD